MFSQCLVLFPITNHYQDFYFMIASKFLGAVGLVQMHIIERDRNLEILCYASDIFPHGILFLRNEVSSQASCCLYPYVHLIRNINRNAYFQGWILFNIFASLLCRPHVFF